MSQPWSTIHLVRLLRPYRRFLAAAIAAMLVDVATTLADPWPLKVIFDSAIGTREPAGWLSPWLTPDRDPIDVLYIAAFALLAIAATNAASSYAEKHLTTIVAEGVGDDLRRTLYHHVQRLSLSFYEQQTTADMVGCLTSDIEAAQHLVGSVVFGVARDGLTLVGMLVVMAYIDWHFTLVALSVVPVLFVVVYDLTRRIKRAVRDVNRQQTALNSVVQESMSLALVIQAFACEEYEEERLDRQSQQSEEANVRANALKARLSPFVDTIVAGGIALVVLIGVRLVVVNALTSGALLVFVLYQARMYKPVKSLSKRFHIVARAVISLERIRQVLATESEVQDRPDAQPASLVRGQITFDGVRFGYAPDRPVLQDVTLSIDAGQSVALVGPTGGGKSTLVTLIPRFYDVWAGVVRIDGLDVRSMTLKSLRESMSLVLQDAVLFRASIWQNIAYGKRNASYAEIVRAAKSANAHDFILAQPNGYETIVGERGNTLSGGQRQRIAIARAIVRDAPILLLDEPSAALDSESEYFILQALERLMRDRTSITIAHRTSTVRRADRIFVLDHGSIVETGNHEQLLASGGLYARLHAVQFQAIADGMESRLG